MKRDRQSSHENANHVKHDAVNTPSPERRSMFWFAVMLPVVLAAIVFSTCLDAEFLNWDDNEYVTERTEISRGLTFAGIQWALTTDAAANWHPLVWVSYMLDISVFGVDSKAMHGTNLCLHLANVFLTVIVIRQYTRQLDKAVIVAALFAVHPQHAEVVAWISERKELLCVFFGLLAMLSWSKYTSNRSWPWWVATHLCFAFSLMSKQMLVTLPFLLVVLECFPEGEIAGRLSLRQIVRKLREKLSMLAMSGTAALMTFLAQTEGGAVSGVERLPMWIRSANASDSVAMYLWQTVAPFRLSPFYPHPLDDVDTLSAVLICICLIVATGCLLKSGTAGMKSGWLWFIGTLVPVIGLVQVGGAARADRYTYFPHIGLFLLFASLPWDVLTGRLGLSLHKTRIFVCGALTLGLSFLSSRECQFWHDSISLWSHALDRDADNCRAMNNLASAYLIVGETETARELAQRALRLPHNQHDASANLTLGTALMRLGETEQATGYLEQAVISSPQNWTALTNFGLALRQSDPRRSRAMLEQAVAVNPTAFECLANLANSEAKSGNIQRAIDLYLEALVHNPDDERLTENLNILRKIHDHQ